MYVISHEVQERMVRHLKEGTTDVADGDLRVPIANFVSAEMAEKEREVLRHQMLMVAHRSEVPEPGSFITRDVLGNSLLLVRQADDSMVAMLNMCPHRGAKVELSPSGKKPAFVCSYHGWAFERNGDLRGVPFKGWYDPIEPECHGLKRIRCEERHGFIWVSGGAADQSVAEYLGTNADAHLASFATQNAVIFREQTFPLDVNWKLVLDGALDVIHPQFLHPEGVNKFIHSGTAVWMEYDRSGQVFSPRQRFAERVKAGEDVENSHRYLASNFFVYPNTLIAAAPDHYEVWSVWPSEKSVTQSTVTIRMMVDREKLTDEIGQRINRSWDILEHAAVHEDWAIEATIQANALANPEGTFLYGRGEASAQHLHRRLEEDMMRLGLLSPNPSA